MLIGDATLKAEDIKPRLLGHWGTTPGLNFMYVHLNRIINVCSLFLFFFHHLFLKNNNNRNMIKT